MAHVNNALLVLLLSILAIMSLVLHCNGDESIFYVQSDEDQTECPPSADSNHCRQLTDYATDPLLLLDSNSTFAFLPGVHVLGATFNVHMDMGVFNLLLRPVELEENAFITCDGNGSFVFAFLQSVKIMFLNFDSCRQSEPEHMFIRMIYIESVTISHCVFTNNTIPALYGLESTLLYSGNNATRNFRSWLILKFCTITLTDNFFIENNASDRSDAGISLFMSNLTTSGTNVFRGNSGDFGGAVYGFNSTMVFTGNTIFINNYGVIGRVLIGASVRVFLSGSAYFESNMGMFGGAIGALNSDLTITGEVAFVENYASYGGAFYVLSSTVHFQSEKNATFVRNSAIKGGAMFLASGSSLSFPADSPGSVEFDENFADLLGGAVFIQDSNTLSYCFSGAQQNVAIQQCSFQITGYRIGATYQTRLYFLENFAVNAGYAIYGGAIDSCVLQVDNNAILYGGELFDQITDVSDNDVQGIGSEDARSSTIASDPFIVCVCNGSIPDCARNSVTQVLYPGASLQVSVVAFGQRNGSVPSTIVAFETNLVVEELERAQGILGECSDLSYTVYAMPGNASLQLYAEGSCLTQGVGLTIEVEVLDCSPGFAMITVAKNIVACMCDGRLLRYTGTCNAADGTILRDDDFWVGYDRELDGLILYPTCPFDYCITDQINFTVEDSDVQCDNNRSGLLCGECSEGLSLLLGSSKCEKCSNDYLALLLFFAAAGLMLVALLLLLNLTVAVGTINGLIFYANIVAVNLTVFFPSSPNTYLDILKVFIAWINLDFGIESCFYDGMDAYALTWLQYIFPLYIWILIGLVFVVSHFSVRASKYLGSNPVAVLATLILLSYTKVLSTIIEAFSSATLDYPEGETRSVWLYDGNVPFLDADDGRHLGLFVASLLTLLLLFIPYTLLLLISQWLQIKSHWKILSWLNKPQLRAFLDAYHAPYKPRHRYWPGLLLLVRFAMLITSARTNSANPSVNLLVIQIFVLVVQVWAWISGGIYKKWYLNVLDAFFTLNLGLLAASTHHIKYQFLATELSSSETQTSLTITSSVLLTAAFVAFIGIVSLHVGLKITALKHPTKYTSQLKEVITMVMTRPEVKEQELALAESKQDPQVTTSYVSLREPLLLDEN